MSNVTRDPRLFLFILLLLLGFACQAQAGEDCTGLATRTLADLNTAVLAMEPADHLRLLRSQVQEALRTDCEGSPQAAYADLRLQELGAGSAPIGILSPAQKRKLGELASAYRARFPDSAPIATVAARNAHSAEAAATAIRLDPHYLPARAALAEALLLAGQTKAAQIALQQIPDLAVLSDGYALQARIRLANGDPGGAIRSAGRALTKRRTMALLEPDAGSLQPICQANEVLGLAHLQRREYTAAAQALTNARFGSERADALLRNPPPGLKEVLLHRHFSPR